MTIWTSTPATTLQNVFEAIHQQRMADFPLLNPALKVEAVGFRLGDDRHWVGTLVTPWSINLLRLPGQPEGWPETAPGGRHSWHFPSGNYEFTIAEEAQLGCYHLCSLFSPTFEFHSHAQARLTAAAVIESLFTRSPESTAPGLGRRDFLRLGR
ncbi:MAG: hypothetical protein RIR00_1251 [Pseudomonadota bacterium]